MQTKKIEKQLNKNSQSWNVYRYFYSLYQKCFWLYP